MAIIEHYNLRTLTQLLAINLLMEKRIGLLDVVQAERATFAKPVSMCTKFAARRTALNAAAVSRARVNSPYKRSQQGIAAFTLAEVVVCLGIVALMFGGIICAYIQGAQRAEWAGYNLAAQALAMQQIEQAKTAMWDSSHNEFTNILSKTWGCFDIPISGTNRIYATNYVQVTSNLVSTSPALYIYMVKVDTVWPYTRAGQRVYYTNTLADYYAPDDQPQ